MLLPILTAPDPFLKQVCPPVTAVDSDVRRLAEDMLETMYDARGIGLAAIQVGVLTRLLVMDIDWREGQVGTGVQHVLINPEIIRWDEALSTYNEGCLSFPEQYAEVKRPASVTVRYLDRDGISREVEASGLLATCVQHEIDHLNGITFVDHLSRLKREMILKRLQKMKKMGHSHGCGTDCGHDH